jgi:hypothetical protein
MRWKNTFIHEIFVVYGSHIRWWDIMEFNYLQNQHVSRNYVPTVSTLTENFKEFQG